MVWTTEDLWFDSRQVQEIFINNVQSGTDDLLALCLKGIVGKAAEALE
jgi:hypothetical protein